MLKKLSKIMATVLTISCCFTPITNVSASEGDTIETASMKVTPMVWTGGNASMALRSDGTVWIWGADNLKPIEVEGLTDVVKICSGSENSYIIPYAIRSDGSLWTIQTNGRATRVNGLTNIKDIVGGEQHTVFLKDDGTVYGKGMNSCGQLTGSFPEDNGIDIPKDYYFSNPTKLSYNDVDCISAGGDTTFLISNNKLWGIGDDYSNGTKFYRRGTHQHKYFDDTEPVTYSVVNNAKDVKTSGPYTLILTNKGELYHIGFYNGYKNGEYRTYYATKVNIPSSKKIVDFAVGSRFGDSERAMALTDDGIVYCWGQNINGELGSADFTGDYSEEPIEITELSKHGKAIDISLWGEYGFNYRLALLEDGTIWAWGNNDHGQLGDGTTDYSSTPVQVKDFNVYDKIDNTETQTDETTENTESTTAKAEESTETTTQEAQTNGDLYLSVPKSAVINNEISVELNIKNADSMAGGKAVISYNADKLEIVSCSAGAGFTSKSVTPTINYKTYGEGKVYLTFASPEDVNLDGTLLNMVFKPKSLGTASFTFDVVDFSDCELNDLTFNTSGGATTIREFMPGDVNGDNFVDYKDSILILRFDAATYTLTEVQQQAGDLNGDGNINYKDAILVLRASSETG